MSNVFVADSSIHGQGLFAAVELQPGNRILKIDDSYGIDLENPAGLAAGELERYATRAAGKIVLLQPPERHVNHSCTPNAYARSIYAERWLIASHAIGIGQEITSDYALNGLGHRVWSCACGATNCLHTMHSDFFHLPLGRQLAYLPLLDDWFVKERRTEVLALQHRGRNMAEYDLLIRNGKVVDGTGTPWCYADIVIHADRIVAITEPGAVEARRCYQVVDVDGHVVCPGFIDIQSHAILPLMVDGRCLSKITQGITTEIMGEAWTPAPVTGRNTEPLANMLFTLDVSAWEDRIYSWHRFRDWLEATVEHGVSPNIGSFLGGGTLRSVGKGMEMGRSSQEELAIMCQTMAEAMEDGAFGVSYALIYPPDAYADTDELVEICKVVARYNGVYITHVRSEADLLEESIAEAIEIGRRSGVPVEIYHLKAAGPQHWHKIPAVIDLIDQARAEGLDVTADMYPYSASSTGLTAVLPPWSAAGGRLYANLQDPTIRGRIKAEMLNPSGDWEAMASRDPSTVMPVGFQLEQNRPYIGKRLDEIARMRDQDWVDAVFDLLLAERQRITTIYYTIDEENLRRQLRLPWIKIATDAGGFDPEWARELGPYHPRAYGTYPRVLGKYVREEGILPLEEAIRKMTWAVAARLGLHDRGLLQPGCYADIVVFDPETVIDRATYEDSHQLSTGIEHVWVNGVQVVAHGVHTDAKPGRIVDGPGHTPQ